MPTIPKAAEPNNRNSNYRELISLCDVFKQCYLRLGHQITINATVTETLNRQCDCPGNQ